MAITNDSKKAIRQEIYKLEFQKANIIERIKQLAEKREALISRRDSLTYEIKNLRADL